MIKKVKEFFQLDELGELESIANWIFGIYYALLVAAFNSHYILHGYDVEGQRKLIVLAYLGVLWFFVRRKRS